MSETSIAFTVCGVGITARQRDVGLAAMRGRFRAMDVAGALLKAGVPQRDPRVYWPRPASAEYIPERAADRLLQAKRKAGRIRPITNRLWERSDEA